MNNYFITQNQTLPNRLLQLSRVNEKTNANLKVNNISKEKINEEFLCVLRKNTLTNQIEIDYVKIETPFPILIENFWNLLDDSNSSLDQVINFIKTRDELNQLTKHYNYCRNLTGFYQSFIANNQNTIQEIIDRQYLMLLNQKYALEKGCHFDIKKNINDYKQELKAKYSLWVKAFSINKTYRLCHEDNSILNFSHRIDGWSNPVYQLTTNFSVEIKTNFGYGRSSYFYTILKYKNIEITPFSEWIDYEFAKFSEIVRYTQSHISDNKYWLEAMEFSKDACNLSMTDEVKFVERYVIDECEKMIIGLEEIFNKENFSFKNRENLQPRDVNKKGHVLVEFRGEKISGALDFISKILEFENITSIKSFICRIEACNLKIQPILVGETKALEIKIMGQKDEIKLYKVIYNKIIEENCLYNKRQKELKKEMDINGEFYPEIYNLNKLNEKFNKKFPEYQEFQVEYENVTTNFRMMNEQLQNLTKVYENIVCYNDKIIHYFEQ
jgi:hypothetical protein